MKYTTLTLLSAIAMVDSMPSRPPDLKGADSTRVPNQDQCAFIYGDPHIFSWDQTAVDCRMGEGDYLYAKSTTTPFEIQVRHVSPPIEASQKNFDEKGWYIGTGSQAIVINTGVPGEPELEVNAFTEGATSWGQCSMDYRFDGETVEMPADATVQGVTFERREAWEKSIWNNNWRTNHYRNFYFEKSGVFLQVRKDYWKHYGCFMNIRICIPDEIKSQGLYGMLGNANGNKADDFMDKNGNVLSPTPQWGQRDTWCNDNWCVADDNTSNLFNEASVVDGCTGHSADPIDEAVKNASPLLKEMCDDDPSCIFDTLASGEVETGLRTLDEKLDKDETIKETEPRVEDGVEEDYCETPEGNKVDCDPYEFEFKCESIGYDFGFSMEGCNPAEKGLFHDLEVTDQNPTCNVGGYNVGSYDMSCSANGEEVTITPHVDGVVKIDGATTGMLYTGFEAGKTYTLTTGPGTKQEEIQNIEFCFKCPKSIVDNDIVTCAADVQECPNGKEMPRDPLKDCQFAECVTEDDTQERTMNAPEKEKQVASSSGDPHFKTWTGEKFDYHGECDLVLIDNPDFNNGQGLKVHVRTTRVKYFSFIEKAAVQIGDDVLEFDNDVENFLINGVKAETNQKHHKTMLGGFIVRRDKKALSIRLQDEGSASARKAGHVAKIDLHTRKNGFPAVIVDAGATDVFKGSNGLLGEWGTGRKLARDGETEFTEVDPLDAEDFALEWQVRDAEPTLFKESRFPQFPQTCTPAKKMVTSRLGYAKQVEEAEEACSHWKADKEDCIFDVLATRDTLTAEEGHLVHVL